jgi:hypothetical protein
MDNKEDDLAVEYLHHVLMNETRDYLSRGRPFANFGDTEMQELWVAAFERCFAERSQEQRRNMDDAAAELRLRNIEPPHDRVKAVVEQLRLDLNRRGPDAPSESLDRAIEEFLEARIKPKN